MKAILYSRWSSLEQSNTTSAPRQIQLTEDFASRNGWIVEERLTDEGRSAWTGDNIKSGALGKLIERLEQEGGDGLVLVVEKLDRLSRQPPLAMIAWVQRACATGLTIATADGGHLIDGRSLLGNQTTILSLIFEGFRAYSESQAKSERVGEAWSKKRDRGAPMTSRCPGWLRIASANTSYRSPTNVGAIFEVVEERAAVVRRIFALTDLGFGKATIARMLNAEGVPVFGKGKGWHASYIQKIIKNPAVIGEFQPCTAPKGGARTPTGEVIRGYFPAIISIDQFERVNDARGRRVLAQQSGHNRLVNLMSGLARCDECGSSMSMLNKGDEVLASGEIASRRYLKCSSAHRSSRHVRISLRPLGKDNPRQSPSSRDGRPALRSTLLCWRSGN